MLASGSFFLDPFVARNVARVSLAEWMSEEWWWKCCFSRPLCLIVSLMSALLLGVPDFVLELIPVLDTLASGAICVLLALSKGWVFALIVLAYFVIVHVVEGDVIEPRLVGKTIGLHPIVSLAALIAGAELFGIPGALLASPVAGVLQALLIAIWTQWREAHPGQFQQAQAAAMERVEAAVAETPDDSEATTEAYGERT